MGTPRRAHRRHFRKTTILALSALAVALAAGAGLALLFPWRAADDHVPAAVVWLGAVATFGMLLLVMSYLALVGIGGIIVLHRDACEERGVPYAPARPRERIIGPVRATIRRAVRPGAPFRPGELAEVRTLPEILATLDERGCLDGMPFMPEMAAYCGHRFTVHRRVDKVWEYAHGTGLRRVRGAVLLNTLRCSGQRHGGCQAACELIWKEAWLRTPSAHPAPPPTVPEAPDLDACASHAVDGRRRYVCQMTEIIRASTPISVRDPSHYWRDLVTGNVRFAPLVAALGVRVFNGVNWRLGGAPWPVLTPQEGNATPHQDLGVQPGQLVRVKSKQAIELTLNPKLRNRGLELGTDMLYCAGGSHRVVARVDRIVDERSGELLEFKTPSILLEGAHANGGTLLTPQNEYFFWREIWLDPEPSPAAEIWLDPRPTGARAEIWLDPQPAVEASERPR